MRAATLCVSVCVAIVSLSVSETSQRSTGDVVDLGPRLGAAQRIVVGQVVDTQASFAESPFGDQLIVSDVELSVEETLKGEPEPETTVQVEGGTVGDLTLTVSDVPTLAPGERVVLLLDQTRAGVNVPHDRGLGIMKLDGTDRVQGTTTTLDDIRARVRALAQ